MCGEAYRPVGADRREHGGPVRRLREEPRADAAASCASTARRVKDIDRQARAGGAATSGAKQSWDEALELGERLRLPQRQVTVLAPTGTIGFMMDCDTTGIEPDIALIKYKKLVGGGMLKIVNNTVPLALRKLGYTADAGRRRSSSYLDEHDTIEGAPGPADRAPAGVRLRLQARQGRALHPLHGPPQDDGRRPAVPLRRDLEDGQHARRTPRSRTSSRPTSRAGSSALKAVAVYRDGCKRSQPLNTSKDDERREGRPRPSGD